MVRRGAKTSLPPPKRGLSVRDLAAQQEVVPSRKKIVIGVFAAC